MGGLVSVGWWSSVTSRWWVAGAAAAASGLAGIARLGENTDCAGPRSVGGMEDGGRDGPFLVSGARRRRKCWGCCRVEDEDAAVCPWYEVQRCDLGFFPRRRSGSDVPRIWFFPQQCGGAARWGKGGGATGPPPAATQARQTRVHSTLALCLRYSFPALIPRRTSRTLGWRRRYRYPRQGPYLEHGIGRSYYATRVGFLVELSVAFFEFWLHAQSDKQFRGSSVTRHTGG